MGALRARRGLLLLQALALLGGCALEWDRGWPDGPGPRPDGHRPDSMAHDRAPDAYRVPGRWIRIKAASFTMGSPSAEPCREEVSISEAETLHTVTLTRDYEIMDREVTQGEIEAVFAYNPTVFRNCGASCAADSVSWHLAARYCNELSWRAVLPRCYICSSTPSSSLCDTSQKYAGAQIYSCPGYRLPTEAEWENAYRAGTQTALHNGPLGPAHCQTCVSVDRDLERVGWYCANSGKTPHPTGLKQPNRWGIHDMAGNVAEWCHDGRIIDLGPYPVVDPWGNAGETNRILRGGSWQDGAHALRGAARSCNYPSAQDSTQGFRCVRSLFASPDGGPVGRDAAR